MYAPYLHRVAISIEQKYLSISTVQVLNFKST